MQIEASAPLHWVAYVAPVFHTSGELTVLFTNRQVLNNVRMIRPSSIGVLDDQTHYVTYRNLVDAPLVHSEPVPIEAINGPRGATRTACDRVSCALGRGLDVQPAHTHEGWMENSSTLPMAGAAAKCRHHSGPRVGAHWPPHRRCRALRASGLPTADERRRRSVERARPRSRRRTSGCRRARTRLESSSGGDGRAPWRRRSRRGRRCGGAQAASS